MNKDFYEELPGMVCAILDDLKEKYGLLKKCHKKEIKMS